MSDPRSAALTTFVQWTAKHVTGDEKGQAQIFLDRLFIALGHPGSLDVGGEPEFRIRKASQDGGGTSFADYVWKPIVLIEMKKRGEKLSRHYRQAFDYWTRLVPGRPRYVVLCNFDEFEVYDFETQMDTPVGRVSLADLPDAFGPLAFLFPGHPSPVFDNDRVAVTRDAAAKLAKCFKQIVGRGIDQALARRFTLQMLVAFFAEDIGLLEKYFVTRLLEECREDSVFDLLGGLFAAMNTQGGTRGGRFKSVPYFNGGLFAEPARVELSGPEIVLLRECAKSDWSKVQPEIFGTVFEQTLDKDERHAKGAHFTHPGDIMKIVGPTIVEPWRERILEAKTAKKLGEVLHRIQHFKVLDPACGSGNFLYLAYRELKRLEASVYEKLETFVTKAEGRQMRMSYVGAQNFFGMDTNPFAIELAKVTMMLARKLAIDELHISEPALPLDNLDQQFRLADALVTKRTDGASIPTVWPPVDVVIGNPPFLGAKLMKPELGTDYVTLLRSLYPTVPGMADHCVYWIRRAHDHIPVCSASDRVTGRAGLVGTQNIRNNASRVGGLDHVAAGGTIVEAVDSQPWSGEANVNVSIVNWVKTQDLEILPPKRRLWVKVPPQNGQRRMRRSATPFPREFDLTYRDVNHISSSLSDKTDVSSAGVLTCNTAPQRVFQGVTPGHKAFVFKPEQRHELVSRDEDSEEILHPYLIGHEILGGDGTPQRFILDFEQRSILQAQRYRGAFAHVQRTVLPTRLSAAEKGKDAAGNMRPHHKQFLERWWRLSWDRAEMVRGIAELPRYLVCSRVTKRPVFVFVHSSIRPGDALQVFLFADDYSFGILQSSAHWLWFITKCSKLTERFRYTPESIFDTFPWPQLPSAKHVGAVADAGRAVRQLRAKILPGTRGGLRALYRTLELPGTNQLREAHAALDAAVMEAYSFSFRNDVLQQLLDLNLQIHAELERQREVTAPGIPSNYPRPERLVSDDCVQP